VLEVGLEALARRAGHGGVWNRAAGEELLTRARVDPALFMRERERALRDALGEAGDRVRAAALQRRLERLRPLEPMIVRYSVDLGARGGRGSVAGASLGVDVDTAAPWPLRLAFGVWDSDALCGFVVGSLGLPVIAQPNAG
jgi:hypothetical protein